MEDTSVDIAPPKLYFDLDQTLIDKILDAFKLVQEEKKRPAFVFDLQKVFLKQGIKTPMLITR
jgi:hypothetical protein